MKLITIITRRKENLDAHHLQQGIIIHFHEAYYAHNEASSLSDQNLETRILDNDKCIPITTHLDS